MPSPWYSKADEHPRGEIRLRAGETYVKSFQLTRVDPDTLAEIADKDLTDYVNLYAEFSNSATGAVLLTTGAGQVTVQGTATEGIIRIVVWSSQTEALRTAMGGKTFDCAVFGTDSSLTDTTDPDPKDLLWVATAVVLAA